MLRRIASILFMVIALISFVDSSSFAQHNHYRHERRSERRSERRVYVEHRHRHRHEHRHFYRREHRERRNRVIIRGHGNRVGVKLKVDL